MYNVTRGTGVRGTYGAFDVCIIIHTRAYCRRFRQRNSIRLQDGAHAAVFEPISVRGRGREPTWRASVWWECLTRTTCTRTVHGTEGLGASLGPYETPDRRVQEDADIARGPRTRRVRVVGFTRGIRRCSRACLFANCRRRRRSFPKKKYSPTKIVVPVTQ